MLIDKNNPKKVLLTLLKDFSTTQTITFLTKPLDLTRVAVWNILQKLAFEKYITLHQIGEGKTSTFIVKLNWDNILVEKALALYLTEEVLLQKRWGVNFKALEKEVNFLILYGSILHSPQQAHDIDILCIADKKSFVKIQQEINSIQKTTHKKIHAIQFTEQEFLSELRKPNEAFVDAIKKGIVLYGQENFIQSIKKVYPQ